MKETFLYSRLKRMNCPARLSRVHLTKQSCNSIEHTGKMTCQCRVGWRRRRRKEKQGKYRYQEVFTKVDVRLFGVIQIEDVTVQTCDFLEEHERVHSMVMQRVHVDWDQRGEQHPIGSRPVSRWPCCSLILSMESTFGYIECDTLKQQFRSRLITNRYRLFLADWLTRNEGLEGREQDESGGN